MNSKDSGALKSLLAQQQKDLSGITHGSGVEKGGSKRAPQPQRQPAQGGFVRLAHINQNPTNTANHPMPVRYAPPIPQGSHSATRPLLAVLESANSLADAYHEVHMLPTETEKAALLKLFEKVFPERYKVLTQAEAVEPPPIDYTPALHRELNALFNRWTVATQTGNVKDASMRGGAELCQLILEKSPQANLKRVDLWHISEDGLFCHNFEEAHSLQTHFGVKEAVEKRAMYEESAHRYWPVLGSVASSPNPEVICVFELVSKEATTISLSEETQSLLRYICDLLSDFAVLSRSLAKMIRSEKTLKVLIKGAEDLQVSEDGTALDVMAKMSTALVECERARFVMFDGPNGTDWRSDLGFGYGRVIKELEATNEPVLVDDLIKDTRFCFDQSTIKSVKNLIAVPVLHKSELMGALFLENKTPLTMGTAKIPRKFNSEDGNIGISLATEYAVHCVTMKAHNVAQRARQNDRSVLEVLRTVVNSDISSVQEVTQSIVNGAMKLTNAETSRVLLLDKAQGKFICQVDENFSIDSEHSPGTESLSYFEPDSEESINPAKESGTPATLTNPFAQELLKRFTIPISGLLMVPLVFDNDVTGVCVLINKKASTEENRRTVPFDEQDEEMFATLSMCATMALRNSTLYDFAVQAAKEAVQLHRVSSELPPPRTISGDQSIRGEPSAGAKSPLKELIIISDSDVAEVLTRRDDGKLIDDDLASLARTIAFDPLALDANTAIRTLMHLLLETGLPQQFGCSEETLCRFILACRRKYRSVFYHNFFHAVDVCQTIWFYLYTKNLASLLEPLEQFVLLITALVHDLDHMGVNNSFHLKTDSPLGILSSASGTNSVLEVHHCNVAIAILDDPEKNIFGGLNTSQSTLAYKMMIDNILATDMARHQEILGTVKQQFEEGVDKKNETHRRLLQQLLIKAADVSNVTKPFEVSKKWAKRVTEEFYLQGDTEKAKGVSVLPMFDRSLNTELASGQLGFINFVASPFFAGISQLLPQFNFASEAVAACKQEWQRIQSPPPENLKKEE